MKKEAKGRGSVPVLGKDPLPKGMRRFCLARPLETWGGRAANREDEGRVAAEIAERFPEIELARPFLEIPMDVGDRGKALSLCLSLLAECGGAILSGARERSEGCLLEPGLCGTAGKAVFEWRGGADED